MLLTSRRHQLWLVYLDLWLTFQGHLSSKYCFTVFRLDNWRSIGPIFIPSCMQVDIDSLLQSSTFDWFTLRLDIWLTLQGHIIFSVSLCKHCDKIIEWSTRLNDGGGASSKWLSTRFSDFNVLPPGGRFEISIAVAPFQAKMVSSTQFDENMMSGLGLIGGEDQMDRGDKHNNNIPTTLWAMW